ncbi:MAG: histidine phosphatase family protein, partial [Patescibacteria group bacterium]
LQTLEGLTTGWPELRQVCRIYEEERIREQSHGLAGLYNDWRVFFALYPEQKKLYDSEGSYWYQWPQGERVPDVRLRIRSWMNTLTRDFANKRVMAISHHLTKLALRANLERWSAEEFQRVDRDEKPINCGVTKYRGLPNLGHNGHFALEYYNRDFSIYL